MYWKLFACLLICLGALRAAEVTAELSTDRVEAGQGALLALKIEGGSPEAHPQIPAVKGLIVNSRGQSQQMQIVNGKVSRSISYNYAVGSHEPGEYEVPSITVRVAGQDLKTPPMKLTVVPSASGAPAGMGQDDEQAAEVEDDRYGFLTFQPVIKDRKHVYPGEIAPVRIKAYFPAGASVQLNGTPRPEGSAFTLHNLTKEPDQSSEVLNGKRYLVVTWYGGLSATKAGSYPASFSLEGTVAVRDRSAKRHRSPFDDPFFGGSMMEDFFAPMVQKDVTLTTPDPDSVEVRELPAEGRPEDFSGAIGHFEFESVQVPSSLQTGEPCRIEARVKGGGNFALLKEPHPQPAGDWKVYDGSGDFMAGDAASFSGSKVFRYNAVPLVPGEREVKLAFSYFDPEAGEYRTVESAPSKVVIAGEATVPPAAAAAKEPAVPQSEGPQLAPLATDPGKIASYEPWSDRAWFYPAISGFAALAVALAGMGVWIRREEDVEKAARLAGDAAIRRALSTADQAALAGDGAGFFTAAREALRIRVAEQSGIKPEAVTLADLRQVDDEDVVGILKEADRVDYSGTAGDAGDLHAWKESLHRGLENLTKAVRAA
ncbi:BatD family protein [Luteolibacter marinus]|uniref:BatD family protein n=1 Tax=Luteolibacter marinus TaxID=2776705 RepID=UPI001D01BF30|nr:BatD family protein [Luteolibacter marinus]